MKNLVFLSLCLSCLGLISCHKTEPEFVSSQPDPNRILLDQPYFNQSNTAFRAPHVENLVALWRTETVKSLVNFTIVNDQRTYEEVFKGLAAPLPFIDFTQNTLLIGRRGADYADGPANIKRMSQSLELVNGELQYKVSVVHRSKGGEWFAFTRLVPKIGDPSTVKLVMNYKLEP